MTIADAHSIAVVRTRLPYIDRRALSQAWFSALHVASDGASKPGLRRPPQAAIVRPQTTRTASKSSATVRATPALAQSARRAAAERPGASAEVAARRVQRARTAAAAVGRKPDDPRSYPPFQTSLSVGIEGARVALLLRREGPTLHVIALCAPANVELVRRALACADAHLRCSGESVRASGTFDGRGACVIDPALANAFDRIATRDADVRGAYRPGFTPASNDVARPACALPDRDPLSVALPEGAYVLTPDANNRVTYSRDGSFALHDGELRAADGRPVLGFALGGRRSLVALRVDPYDAALGRVANPRVEGDGTVTYARTTIDPRSGERRSERVAIGRLALARFPAGTQPERIDASHVLPPQGVGPHIGVPADGSFGPLITQARDTGRVDIIAGLEKMKEAYVTFEALRAAHHGRGEAEKTVMDLVK